MSLYKRLYQAGGNYFFTLVTYQRFPFFANPHNVIQFKIAMNRVKKKYPFSLYAMVILPDHLHLLWKLPENDKDFSTRLRLIKRYFSLAMPTSINHRKEKEVWQRRFWEHVIRNEKDWQNHMDYIHYNPVKHGLIKSPKDWMLSTFNFWVAKGLYEENWGAIEEPSTVAGMKEVE